MVDVFLRPSELARSDVRLMETGPGGTLVSAETGTSVESESITIWVSDLGAGIDTVVERLLAAYDTALGIEGETSPSALVASTDTATGTEASSVGLVSADTGAGTEADVLAALRADLDTATGTEAVAARSLTASEAVSGVESAQVSVGHLGADEGLGGDTEALQALLAGVDGAVGAEAAVSGADILAVEWVWGADAEMMVRIIPSEDDTFLEPVARPMGLVGVGSVLVPESAMQTTGMAMAMAESASMSSVLPGSTEDQTGRMDETLRE